MFENGEFIENLNLAEILGSYKGVFSDKIANDNVVGSKTIEKPRPMSQKLITDLLNSNGIIYIDNIKELEKSLMFTNRVVIIGSLQHYFLFFGEIFNGKYNQYCIQGDKIYLEEFDGYKQLEILYGLLAEKFKLGKSTNIIYLQLNSELWDNIADSFVLDSRSGIRKGEFMKKYGLR